MILQRRLYSNGSKALAIINPSGWIGKELAKQGAEDETKYKDKRLGDAILSNFSPISSSVLLQKAEKARQEGKDQKEISKIVKKGRKARIAEALLTPVALGGLAGGALYAGSKGHAKTAIGLGAAGLGLGAAHVLAPKIKGLHTSLSGRERRRKFETD